MGRRSAFRVKESKLQILLTAARVWESRALVMKSRYACASRTSSVVSSSLSSAASRTGRERS
jgi:hypothetical protein